MWVSQKDKTYMVFGVKTCNAAKMALTTQYQNVDNEEYKNAYVIIIDESGKSKIIFNIGKCRYFYIKSVTG